MRDSFDKKQKLHYYVFGLEKETGHPSAILENVYSTYRLYKGHSVVKIKKKFKF